MSPSVEPFDEAKYKALMDGLECSECLLSSLEEGIRIDAELYQKKYVVLEDFAETHETTTFIRETNLVKKGIFDISASCYSSFGIPFVRISNIKNMLLSKSDLVFIPESENEKNQDTQLSRGDIILSKTGSPAASYVNFDICNVSQDTVAIKLKNPSQIFSEYVVVYLNTVYGLAQMGKRFTGNIQKHLNLDDCKKRLIIPAFSKPFQRRIKELFLSATEDVEQADRLYNKTIQDTAKSLCYCEASNSESISIISMTKSFKETGRLDAEYYQPKYDEYLSLIANYKNGYSIIKDEFLPIREICDRSLAEYQYVEIGDVDIGTGSASYNTIETDDLPDNAKIITKKNDVLVSTVRPNRGAVAILEEDNLLVSGAFTVLRERGAYKKEVLQVLLRTPLYRDWLLRYNVGTSYPVIKDDDVLNMPIPLFEDKIQTEIVAKVQESFALRHKSKQLLEYAKQAVEMAIEQGEDVALEWLKDKCNEEV